jgi:hypothetical protein
METTKPSVHSAALAGHHHRARSAGPHALRISFGGACAGLSARARSIGRFLFDSIHPKDVALARTAFGDLLQGKG